MEMTTIIIILGGLKLFFTVVSALASLSGSAGNAGKANKSVAGSLGNQAGMSDLDRFMADMQQQQFDEFSRNSVTPFEMGGFDMEQGNSFNMDFGGSDFGGFGGCGMF